MCPTLHNLQLSEVIQLPKFSQEDRFWSQFTLVFPCCWLVQIRERSMDTEGHSLGSGDLAHGGELEWVCLNMTI